MSNSRHALDFVLLHHADKQAIVVDILTHESRRKHLPDRPTLLSSHSADEHRHYHHHMRRQHIDHVEQLVELTNAYNKKDEVVKLAAITLCGHSHMLRRIHKHYSNHPV